MASSRSSLPAAASAVADELLDLGILEDDLVTVDSLDRAELELWPEPDMSQTSGEVQPDDLELELGKLVEEAMEVVSDASVSDDGSEAPPAETATPTMPAPSRLQSAPPLPRCFVRSLLRGSRGQTRDVLAWQDLRARSTQHTPEKLQAFTLDVAKRIAACVTLSSVERLRMESC